MRAKREEFRREIIMLFLEHCDTKTAIETSFWASPGV